MPLLLKVIITSFSYKKGGYPLTNSLHGGGFVFDCRAIPNPGREAVYKDKTGKDSDVKSYLEKIKETESFYQNVYGLVDQAIKRYKERGFDELLVSFGCTGGQHRSVYFSERLAEDLKKDKELDVVVLHREFPNL